mgnify:CR=1 FL=1
MIGKRHDEKNLLKESLKRAILKESFRNVLHRVLLRESQLSKIDPDIIQNIITNVKPAEVAAGIIFSVYYINKSENKKKGKRSPEDFKKDVEEFTEEIAKKFRVSDNFLNSKEDGLLIVASSLNDIISETINSIEISNFKNIGELKKEFLTNFIKVRMESCFQGRSRNAQGLGGRDVTDAIRANPDSNKRLPDQVLLRGG